MCDGAANLDQINADPAGLADWLDDMFLPSEVLDWPTNGGRPSVRR